MKKTLSILITAAMLTSSAAYAAPNDGHNENGRENPVRAEQRTDRTEAKPEKAPSKAEKNETKPEKAKVKTEKPETKPEKAEIKPEKPEFKSEKPEAKSEKKSSDMADNSDDTEAHDTENTDNEVSNDTDKYDDKKPEMPERPDKMPDKPEKEFRPNDEFRKELDNIKKNRREKKAGADEVINDLRDIFHEAPKEDRKEILGEIAEIKKELKDESIGMFMRGKHVDFDKYDGVEPEIVKDRTLVPLRAVSETLGAEVEWNGENKTVMVTYNDSTIIVTIDSQTALVNGEEVEIDSPALIKKDRVLVPIRIIAEALGLTVEWDNDSHSVIVDEKESTVTSAPVETTEPTATAEPTATEELTATTEPIATEDPTVTTAPTEEITE